MDAGISSARPTRAQYRHQLRTLNYVTLDQANGGVVRNLTHGGIGVQVVTAVRPRQQFRMRFELRYPRLRVEVRGEVIWATFSGQCGIRFIDLSPRLSRQIDEWIFGNLLEEVSLHAEREGWFFAENLIGAGKGSEAIEEDDGLMLSGSPVKVIELPQRREMRDGALADANARQEVAAGQLDWLSQPLSGRSLIWAIHMLVVMAGMLLFTLVFLWVNREAPRWPLAMVCGAGFLVTALYWGFFQILGGSSLGARLARLNGNPDEDEEARGARFR